jgi:NAD(P)-dependent dehydrogenase (short-subunit alcohol dehydrogenase family)
MSKHVVVIIGAGGMGEAIARRIGAGAKLVLADFNEEILARLESSLGGDGFDVLTRKVDASSRESLAALADEAASLGSIDAVIHTAGLSPAQAPIKAILAVDLLGFAFSLEEFGRVIAPGGAGVYIASMAGTMAAGSLPAEVEAALRSTPSDELLALPMFAEGAVPNAGAAYSLSKRANQLRVQSASLAWGARGARVNTISPGVISTPMGQQELASESGAGMRAMVDGSGTGRLGTPSDIAAAAAFLVGPDATFITGTDLLVDGGTIAAINSGAVALPRG